MPFLNGTRSCWSFLADLSDGRVPAQLVPILLERHALECNCPCAPCLTLKRMWIEGGRREANGTPAGLEN